MRAGWYADLESLEGISQDSETREVILRMAGLARGGRLGTFRAVVGSDPDLDEHTRRWALDLASDEGFLFAVEDYVARCTKVH